MLRVTKLTDYATVVLTVLAAEAGAVLSAAGLAERDRRVFAACRERGIPVVLTMGGGYGHVIAETVEVQMGTFRAALQAWETWRPV